MNKDVRLFGLIGHPLDHSFSKSYFEKKFKENNLNCQYENYDISHISELGKILKNNALIGFNVTIPHKVSVLSRLDDIEQDALAIGAVNVVKIENKKLSGFNTDHLAFKQSLLSFIDGKVKGALVLGSGGASKAVNHALNSLQISSYTVSRSGKGDISYEEIDGSILSNFNLIINASPTGTFPNIETYPSIPYHLLCEDHFLFDLVYNPEVTEFMKKGQEMGCKTRNGYDMLVNQAEMSWNIWNQ